jgi:hypothetical protein
MGRRQADRRAQAKLKYKLKSHCADAKRPSSMYWMVTFRDILSLGVFQAQSVFSVLVEPRKESLCV